MNNKIEKDLPKNMYLWLYKLTNLTDSIVSIFSECNVSVISQKIVNLDEKVLLDYNLKDENFWVRKIQIHANEVLLINAQVIIPIVTYNKYKDKFDLLKNTSIGKSWFFEQYHLKNISRSDFMVYKNLQFWERSSIFKSKCDIDYGIIVEKFMIDFPKYKKV